MTERGKLSEYVEEIRVKYLLGGVTQKELAEEYGAHKTAIANLLNGRSYRNAPGPLTTCCSDTERFLEGNVNTVGGGDIYERVLTGHEIGEIYDVHPKEVLSEGEGWIYTIQTRDTHCFKPGFTGRSLSERMPQYRTHMPEPFIITNVIPGPEALEKDIQNSLSRWRIPWKASTSEWFMLEKKAYDVLDSYGLWSIKKDRKECIDESIQFQISHRPHKAEMPIGEDLFGTAVYNIQDIDRVVCPYICPRTDIRQGCGLPEPLYACDIYRYFTYRADDPADAYFGFGDYSYRHE